MYTLDTMTTRVQTYLRYIELKSLGEVPQHGIAITNGNIIFRFCEETPYCFTNR